MEPHVRAEVSARLEEPQYAFSLNLFADAADGDVADEVAPGDSPQDSAVDDDGGSPPSYAESPPCKRIELKMPRQPKAQYPSLMANAHARGQRARQTQVQSAPMLPAVLSPHVPSMFVTKSTSWRPSGELTVAVSSSGSGSTQEFLHSRTKLQPLGSNWREGDMGPDGEPVRLNADEGGEFIHGCVPNWGRERSVRSVSAVEHKLTWAYYHMRNMRFSIPPSETSKANAGQRFDFWTDLRPPFRVEGMERDPHDDGSHVDGLLYRIIYSCGLDYVTERKWGRRSSEGTFENAATGTAEARIPKDFPQVSKHIHVLSWGSPTLKSKKALKVPDPVTVDPKAWSPITTELRTRSQSGGFAQLKRALQRANTKMADSSVKQRPWQKALLKKSATLADFVKAEKEQMDEDEHEASPRKRDLRIRTACAGFVNIEG